MNRKSMGDIISKLLLFNDESDENFPKKKNGIIKKSIRRIKNFK